MTFAQLAKDRYSVRGFSNQPVEQEKLDAILETARMAPTACNKQPQRIYVLKSQDALNKIKACTPFDFNATVIIMVCYDAEDVWVRPFDEHNSGDIDAAIVTTHIILQAAELGLGTTWVGYFNPEEVVKHFDLPANIVPVALLPLGYPQMAPHKMHSERKPLSETVITL